MRTWFAPDPLTLTRSERFEAWLWKHRIAYCLLGWVIQLAVWNKR